MDDMTERGVKAGGVVTPIVKAIHAALTPADLATLAKKHGLVVIDQPEVEKCLITIEAHCTVIIEPDFADDAKELAHCIKTNVAEIRQAVLEAGRIKGGEDAALANKDTGQ